MGLIKKSEFAKVIGKTVQYVSMNVIRGNIHVDKDNLIDTKHPLNKEFIKRFEDADIARMGMGGAEPGRPKGTKKPKEPKGSKEEKEISRKNIDKMSLDVEIKKAELRKKEEEIKKLQSQNAKLSGEQIPTDLVRVIFSQHFKSVTTAFHQAADNFIMIIQQQTKMNRTQTGKLKSDLVELINQAVDEAQDLSKDSLKNIIAEYKEVRGKGERK